MADGLVIELKLDGFATYSEQAKAALAAALEAEAKEFVTDAQSRCPVRTGALRDSIGYTVEDELTVSLEATQPYALYVDQGTRHASAQPFFTPAIDQVTVRFPERVKTALDGLEGEKLL